MNVLDRADIKGFWETRTISLKLHRDVNFFIGVNGSGKTTVINIIAAALSADFENLIRLPFSSVTLHLSEVNGRRKPSIEVSKQANDRSPYPKIVYSIKEKASEPAEVFELGAYEEELLLRRNALRHGTAQFASSLGHNLIAKLSDLVNVSWLSIHRASGGIGRSKRDESFESSVDQKLDELSISLAKYFSVLSSKVAEEIAEFQRNMIVSLLTEQTEHTVFNSINNLNLDEEKRALADIFQKLSIRGAAKTKLDKHYTDVQSARDQLKAGQGLPLSSLMLLVSAYRSHKVVQDWNALLKKQEEILAPRVAFLSVLNTLYQKKKIDINQRNELEANVSAGRRVV